MLDSVCQQYKGTVQILVFSIALLYISSSSLLLLNAIQLCDCKMELIHLYVMGIWIILYLLGIMNDDALSTAIQAFDYVFLFYLDTIIENRLSFMVLICLT